MNPATRRIIPPLLILMVLNLVDWAMTTDEIELGMAKEGNPIGAALFGVDPMYALLFKVFIVGLCCLAIFLLRARPVMYKLAVGAMGLFLLLSLWHVFGHVLWYM